MEKMRDDDDQRLCSTSDLQVRILHFTLIVYAVRK